MENEIRKIRKHLREIESILAGLEQAQSNGCMKQQPLFDPTIGVQHVVDAWNELSASHPQSIRKVSTVTSQRVAKLKKRLSEANWPWEKALSKLPIGGIGWQPDFDWLISNHENAHKLAEGKYDWRSSVSRQPKSMKDIFDGPE